MGVPCFGQGGAFTGLIGSCVDITADRLAAQDRKARAEAEEALRLRDDVLALAAHDLRSPLTGVLARAELILLQIDRLGVSDTSWLVTQMNALRAAALQMRAITGEIADVALLQVGQELDLHLENVDLGELAASVAEEYAGAMRAAQVVMELPSEPVLVRVDRARLARVIRNLVDNGIKYSRPGTPVRTAVRTINTCAVVTVCDQGVGIPESDLPRVFTHFFRSRTTAGIPGSGLGLAGAKVIVEQHGGDIAIHSAVGSGTTVTIRLPLAGPGGPRPQAPKSETTGL
jgi:signal transduction histidine kinase